MGVMPMTYEEKRRWLWRYQESLRGERELAEEVEQLQTRACKVTPSLSGMPGGTGDGQALPWKKSSGRSRNCRHKSTSAGQFAEKLWRRWNRFLIPATMKSCGAGTYSVNVGSTLLWKCIWNTAG